MKLTPLSAASLGAVESNISALKHQRLSEGKDLLSTLNRITERMNALYNQNVGSVSKFVGATTNYIVHECIIKK
jgi:hypothetical protein